MKEMCSKPEDCHELSNKLKKELNNKIKFLSFTYLEYPCGEYLSSYRKNKGEYIFNAHTLPFYLKYSKDEFLRIGVGSIYPDNTLGEKLAALSDFYEILSKEYGEPTVFYTTEDDDEKILTLQWAFINKEEEILKFKNGTYFDDADIDTLIVFGAKDNSNLNEMTKRVISKSIGLPFELLYLVDEDIKNYIKHKIGKELSIPYGSRIDGLPVISYEKKLERRRY